MRTVSKIILILLSPLILLSGSGIMLIQHHCRMAGETNYSFAGLGVTNTCCDPGSLYDSGLNQGKPVIDDPENTCCTLHALFLKSANFNGQENACRIIGPTVQAETTVYAITSLRAHFPSAFNFYSFFGPPPEVHSDPAFLSVFRL